MLIPRRESTLQPLNIPKVNTLYLLRIGDFNLFINLFAVKSGNLFIFLHTSTDNHSVFVAPPVLARHSWSMNAISLKAKTVPGIPPLSAVGPFDLGDGGLLFNGKSTWLGATISQQDCLIDPGRCISGFTLATKLFLHSSVASYATPKYIVDTGASSAKARGISMYVMSGKVFFELATSSKVWTVSAPVDVNSWLFISITWSNDNGLLLYFNGVKKVEDKTGRLDSGRASNLHDNNLCVGRDAKDGGVDYAQFMMASLLSFNSYLSPLVMRATYTFYWRNGEYKTLLQDLSSYISRSKSVRASKRRYNS